MSTHNNYATLAAERRGFAFALPAHEDDLQRSVDADGCKNLLQQAACLAVRAGRGDIANGTLTLLGRMEARS